MAASDPMPAKSATMTEVGLSAEEDARPEKGHRMGGIRWLRGIVKTAKRNTRKSRDPTRAACICDITNIRRRTIRHCF